MLCSTTAGEPRGSAGQLPQGLRRSHDRGHHLCGHPRGAGLRLRALLAVRHRAMATATATVQHHRPLQVLLHRRARPRALARARIRVAPAADATAVQEQHEEEEEAEAGTVGWQKEECYRGTERAKPGGEEIQSRWCA